MAEDRRDVEASRALHVHEKRIRALYKALELVTAVLLLVGWVQKIGAAFSHVENCRLT